jgi:hypothetical protein
VAGIVDTLIKGAVGSLGKDKITSTLTPTQMELASFILNPQYYMAEKGVNKIAEILGYGSDYKDLSADAKINKDYYKAIMRDALGNVLPDSIGDLLRASPKTSEANQAPAGTYTTWDPATQSWVEQGSSNPAAVPNSSKFEDFMRELNAVSDQEVGPPEEYSNQYNDAEYDFTNSISDFRTDVSDATPTRSLSSQTSTTDDGAPTGYTLDPNIGAVVPVTSTESLAPVGSVYDANIGANVPVTESLAPVGSTYDPNLGMNVPVTENVAPMGYTFDVNTGTVVPAAPEVDLAPPGHTFDMDTGTVVPAQEMPFEPDYYGGGGGKLENYYYSDYRRGGQIRKGKR